MPAATLAGDWKDDDGIVIDTLLDENTDGVDDIRKNATEPFVAPKEKPAATTRIIGSTVTMSAGDPPQQLLWANDDRKSVHLHMLSVADVDDQCRYSHDPGLLNSAQSCPAIVASQPIDGMPHTGNLWVLAPSTNTGPIIVSCNGVL